MKRKLLCSILLCFFAVAVFGTTLAENGKTGYRIVISENPSLAVSQAAKELSEYLKRSTGADFPVVPESKAPAENVIHVGNTVSAKAKHDSAESWSIDIRDGKIFLSGGSDRGTFYAVCEFLERYAEVRWLGINMESVPKHDKLTIPDQAFHAGTPAFPEQRLYYFFLTDNNQRNAEYQYFSIHNKINIFNDPKYGYGKRSGSPRAGHAFIDYSADFPAEICWMNPAGKRVLVTNAAGGQICYSLPEVRKRFRAKLKNYIESDRVRCEKAGEPYPTLYDISANDCNVICHCPECRREAEKYGVSGMVMRFTNDIASSIKEKYPDVLVQMFAYKDALNPPEKTMASDNLIVRLAGMDMEFNGSLKRDVMRPLSAAQNSEYRELLAAWSQKVKNLAVWDYWKMYYEPFANPKGGILDRAEYLKFYRDAGVKSVFIEAEISFEKPESFYDLRLYTAQKLMDNPDRDMRALVEDFMKHAYRQAARPMTDYLNYLETRMKEEPAPLARAAVPMRKYLDAEFFRKSNAFLDEAEELAAGDTEVLNRIRQERLVLDIALLNLPKISAQLEKEFPEQMLTERMWANYPVYASRYWNAGSMAGRLQELKEDFDVKRNRPALPEQFQNKSVVDLVWSELKSGDIVDDPDAAGGKACQVTTKFYNGTPQEFHAKDFKCGVYSQLYKKGLAELEIPKAELPQDEKYHFYYIGRTALTDMSVLWVHWTWWMGIRLDKVYDYQNSTMPYDVYLSVKLQGPSYVSGSTQQDAVRVDRAVFVRTIGDKSDEPDIPAELADKKVIELPSSAFTYHVAKVADREAARKIAFIPAGKQKNTPEYHAKSPAFGSIDVKAKKRDFTKLMKKGEYAEDEKYHLYKLGRVDITPDTYLWVHWTWDMNIALGKNGNAGSHDVYVSLKLQGPDYVAGSQKKNNMFVDRVFLVKN